jgi:hypothetical protein
MYTVMVDGAVVKVDGYAAVVKVPHRGADTMVAAGLTDREAERVAAERGEGYVATHLTKSGTVRAMRWLGRRAGV